MGIIGRLLDKLEGKKVTVSDIVQEIESRDFKELSLKEAAALQATRAKLNAEAEIKAREIRAEIARDRLVKALYSRVHTEMIKGNATATFIRLTSDELSRFVLATDRTKMSFDESLAAIRDASKEVAQILNSHGLEVEIYREYGGRFSMKLSWQKLLPEK